MNRERKKEIDLYRFNIGLVFDRIKSEVPTMSSSDLVQLMRMCYMLGAAEGKEQMVQDRRLFSEYDADERRTHERS